MLLQTTPDRDLGTRSLTDEVVLDDVPVLGTLPPWLQGTLLRNGPARFEAGEGGMRHWFDGLAMLHRFSIADGHVSYANRFLRTKAFAAAEEGVVGYREFASDPCRTLFNRVASLFVQNDISDNAVVNMARLGDRFIAMSETPLPVVFDPMTLQTLGIDDRPPAQLPTAHPHIDAASGDIINAAVHLGPRSDYRLYTRSATGGTKALAKIAVRRPAYLHSFGLTSRFIVMTLGPLTVEPTALALSGRPFIENYRWRPRQGTQFIAVERATGRVAGRWETDPLFVFHHINAFEESCDLVVDLCAYPDAQVIDDLYLDRLRAGAAVSQARPRRFRLPLSGGAVTEQLLADVELELPRIDDSRNTLPYKVVWGTSRVEDFADALVRLDVKAGETVTWHEPGCRPGEPVFVKRPCATAEDDGVLLSLVLDSRQGHSSLLVLDAATMDEVARAELPHHIPFGIHGQFYDDIG